MLNALVLFTVLTLLAVGCVWRSRRDLRALRDTEFTVSADGIDPQPGTPDKRRDVMYACVACGQRMTHADLAAHWKSCKQQKVRE